MTVRVGGGGADGVGDAGVAAGHRHGGAGRHGRVVGLLDQVQAGLVVGVEVVAERLVEHIDVVDGHGVIDGLEEGGVEPGVLGSEDVQPDQAGARGDALDADVARAVEGQGAVLADVVHPLALGGDGAGVEEGLVTPGGHRGALSGEVLVVDEDVGAVGADEVGVVDVEAVGDERDLDARPVDAERPGRLGGGIARVGADGLERLRLEQRGSPGRRAGAGHRGATRPRRGSPRVWRRCPPWTHRTGSGGG